MKHVNLKMVLGFVIATIFLFGTIAAPVSALQTNIKIETYNQGFASGTNNHTYMYVEPDPLDFVSRSNMHLNEDLDYSAYRYDSSGWSTGSGSFFADSNVPFNWMSFNGWGAGTHDNPTNLPGFFDFVAADGSDHVVNTTLETRTFSLAMGQHTPVKVDRGYTYIGTLGIGGEEFVHLTIDSRQDGVSWSVVVLDPEGRFMNSYGGSEGDIWTVPFAPSVAGTYYIILQAFPVSGTFTLFDLLPVAVAPQPIALGEIVTGELPTGEILTRSDTGSWVHQELAPTVHTYKVTSPGDVASVTYAYNYPSFFLPPTQPSQIQVSNKYFIHDYNGGSRHTSSINTPQTGEIFYRDGPCYVTVIGGDGTTYSLYNQLNSQGMLPVNEEFQFENYIGTTVTRGYSLDIDEPSILRINSTATGGELSIRLTGVDGEGYIVPRTVSFSALLATASEYYLPVGEYFVEMAVSNNVNEWVEFHVGPIVDTTSASFVEVGGFFVDTEFFQRYNMTIFLDNPDNVTVNLEVAIYDASGNPLYITSTTLANWWDGSSIIPHSSIANNASFFYSGRQWYDSGNFVAICAYTVSNNTQGATNTYYDYPVDLTIVWQNGMDALFTEVADLNAISTGSHNFTLLLPAPGTQWYGLLLNTTPGTWYNVSVMTADVDAFSSHLYTVYDERTHRVDWSDISTTYVGSLSDLSFQFGAMSDTSFLDFVVGRDQSIEGYLWIQVTPMDTHPLDVLPITPLGPDLLGVLGGVVLPAAIGVGVIIVVYIVYVKRFKK